MHSASKSFAERIMDLEVQYDTQKGFSRSLGVTSRTLRNWKNRETPPSGWSKRQPKEGVKSTLKDMIKRRESYYFHSGEGNDPDRGRVTMSDITGGPKDLFVNNATITDRTESGEFVPFGKPLQDMFPGNNLDEIIKSGDVVEIKAYAFDSTEDKIHKTFKITIRTEEYSSSESFSSAFWNRFRSFWERNYDNHSIVLDEDDFDTRANLT